MIIRSAQPEVIEYPFSELRTMITPTEKFYVRDHFPRPELNLDTWRLRIEGAVNRTVELTYKDILAMPQRSIVATLECAGNSRSFLVPPSPGVQWGLGGIGTAEWSGASLSTVLKEAGIKDNACDVILEGADQGKVDPSCGPHPQEAIHFARSLPLQKALDDDVLLAYCMNGEPLTVAHGFPVRAIVPGWYAVASVKWLTRMIVSERPFHGYFQSVDYGYWRQDQDGVSRVPITTLRVKSEIARPQAHEVLRINQDYEIFGACWVGETDIQQVEVSTDGSETWQSATFLGEAVRNAWRLWKHNWRTPPAPQKVVLYARALDGQGNSQPMYHNHNNEDYMINFCLPIEVELR